jgi:ABC-type Mn2+/Zn2+ transport system ATPase subunit
VTFNNDLSVDIVYLGKELDFYNLSRGEMTRVSLSLSFAFRDVWENLFQPINLLFVDEALDSGMDFIGAMNSMALLNEFKYNRNKSIFLISHKEELASHSTNVLKAIKEHGFTTYSYE